MRIYDGKYLSVTSILELKNPFNEEAYKKWCQKQGLDHEKITKTSQIIGSKVSEHIENLSHGLEWLTAPCTDYLEEAYKEGVEDFVGEYEVEASEVEVVCEELNYAGRFDGIIFDGKKRYLADWKTYGAWKKEPYKRDSKKIKSAREQLSLYAHALDWEEGLAVVVFKNDGTWDFEELEFDEDVVKWVRENQELILSTIQNEKNKRLEEEV
jgi:hypothetical protein